MKPGGPDAVHPLPPAAAGSNAHLQKKTRSVSSQVPARAPLVQTTTQGAEIRDALQRKAARERQLGEMKKWQERPRNEPSPSRPSDLTPASDKGEARSKHPSSTRRFHLARHAIVPVSFKNSSGVRKHKQRDRSRLATVVEKHVSLSTEDSMRMPQKSYPIDRILADKDLHSQNTPKQEESSLVGAEKRLPSKPTNTSTKVGTFVRFPEGIARTGNSISEHPSTWNYDSDQLADELAAFALELDNADGLKGNQEQKVDLLGRYSPIIADSDMEVDDEYVYETFIRVPRSELSHNYEDPTRNIGTLFIDEEDEELWKAYAEDDDDSEWDEEDADSNGMLKIVADVAVANDRSGGQSKK